VQGPERDALRLRADFWYRQAEPSLAGGLAGLKVKQRLAELEKLGADVPTPSPRVAASPPQAVAPFDEKKAKAFQAQWSKYLKVPVVVANSIGRKFTTCAACGVLCQTGRIG